MLFRNEYENLGECVIYPQYRYKMIEDKPNDDLNEDWPDNVMNEVQSDKVQNVIRIIPAKQIR